MNSPLIGDLLYSNLTPRPFPIDRDTRIFNHPFELAPVAKLLGEKRKSGLDIRRRVVVGVIESFYGGFLGWWWPKFCIEGIGRVNVGVRECRVRWAC